MIKPLKKLKCELCEKEVYILVKVEISGDSYFTGQTGVCWNCFKLGKLDEQFFIRAKYWQKQ